MSKFIGLSVIGFVLLLALGSVLAPFVAIIYALFTFSLTEIIKGALILYVALIPISVFAQRN